MLMEASQSMSTIKNIFMEKNNYTIFDGKKLRAMFFSDLIWASTPENLSTGTKGDSNQSVQLQRLARILRFSM